jgi:luciferase family oxidoreductase group 1
MPLFSILDLCPIIEGGDTALAFRRAAELARQAEKWGYYRYWLAEHHNLPGIASAATSVVMGHIAGLTSRIRIGAGGIMLPNHAPLLIAEQFGTLASLYPHRIDLGLGRAPGGDRLTAHALRRGLGSSSHTFPEDVLELQSYFAPATSGQSLRAVPGAGLDVPLYLLGSSDFSAQLAAELGLPFAFASHFAPEHLHVALRLYRENFQPSRTLAKPHVIVGIGLYAAETDDEARRIFTSAQQMGLALIRGRPRELPPPVDSMSGCWNAMEEAAMDQRTRYAVVGSRETVAERLQEILAQTQADEIIATAQIHDLAARLRSFELGAKIFAQKTDAS